MYGEYQNTSVDFWRRVLVIIFYVSMASVTILVIMTWVYPKQGDPNLNTINRVDNNERIDELEKRLNKIILEIEKLEGGKKLIGQWIKEQRKYNEGRVKSKQKGGE